MNFKLLLFGLILLGFMGCESDTATDGDNSSDTNNTAEKVPEDPTFHLKWNVPTDYSFLQKGKDALKFTHYPGTDQEEVFKLSLTTSRKFNINGLDKEGAFTVKMNYMGVMGEYKGPDRKWLYDSNAAKPGEKADGFERLSGSSASFRFDPNTGQVLDVYDGEDLAKIITNDGKPIENPDKVLREALQPEWYIFPDGPVKMGGEWTREIKIKHRYHCLIKNTYQLASRENGQAKITFSGSVTPLPKGEIVMGRTGNGEDVYYELNGTTSGEFVVDEASGEFFSSNNTTTAEGSQIILGVDGLEKERIPVKIEMEGFSEYGQK